MALVTLDRRVLRYIPQPAAYDNRNQQEGRGREGKLNAGAPNWTLLTIARSAHPNYTQTALALLALACGAMFYLVVRPAQSVMLFQALGLHSLYDPAVAKRLSWLTGSLPSCIHVFAFSLLSVATFERQTRRRVTGVVLFWVAVNVLFELGQTSVGKHLITQIGTPTDRISGSLVAYFLNGTFDWNDIVFALCGGLIAYLTIRFTIKRRSS